ncbi:MAG: UvrB/UvrC motif-containing protein [Candidatus Colwellbacteria bacterium]|nr:UvrB/UvrC motif-containing protein [Candidatus Colwellbacteria bacterium]
MKNFLPLTILFERAAELLDFELAAILRDEIRELSKKTESRS